VRRPGCVETSGVNHPVTRTNIPEDRRPQTGSGFNWLSGHEPVTGYREYGYEPTAGSGKVDPTTRNEGPGRKQRYTATLSLTSALDRGGWSTPRPGCFTLRKDPVTIVQEVGWAPTGFDPRTVQPVASRCTE